MKTLFLITFFQISTIFGNLIVELPKGKIQGIKRLSQNKNEYYAFHEIPYAAPPVGVNRFQEPKEPAAWDNILNCTKNTKICFQDPSSVFSVDLEQTEDCLYLNVYTPLEPGSGKKIPVLLWIHGGSLISGTGAFNLYNPKFLMDSEIVVVSINYRLGALGFVGTDDEVIPLNLGLKDQRLAIEWVRENIHLFGGDNNHITLNGESAGSVSVGFQILGQSVNENLFQSAIMQSGSPVSSILKQANATDNAIKLGHVLDPSASFHNTSELLTLFKKANASAFINGGITGGISVENKGPFSYHGYQAFMDKTYKKIPTLIGFNSEEILALTSLMVDPEIFDENPSLMVLSNFVNVDPKKKEIMGKLYKEIYVGNDTFVNNPGPYLRYYSDFLFVTGITKQVELSADEAPHYFYQFSYKGLLASFLSEPEEIPAGAEKVGHGEDLFYMWDLTFNSDLEQFPKADVVMQNQFVKMWTNFVKYNNPTPDADPLLYNFSWIPAQSNSIKYFNINTTFEMRENPRQYPEVNHLLNSFILPPYDTFS